MDIEEQLSDKANLSCQVLLKGEQNTNKLSKKDQNGEVTNDTTNNHLLLNQQFPQNQQETTPTLLKKPSNWTKTTLLFSNAAENNSTQFLEEPTMLQNNPSIKLPAIASQKSLQEQTSTPQQQIQSSSSSQSSKLILSLIPKQVQKPFNVFYLKGGLFIDCNRYQDSRLSSLNYYSQLYSSHILRDRQVLYVKYSSDLKIYDSYQLAIAYLKDFPNQDCNELSDKLSTLEQFLQVDEKVKLQIMSLVRSNPMLQQFMFSKQQEFSIKREKYLASLSKDRYYAYLDYFYDYQNMCYSFEGAGFNELSSRLLGCDLDSMQEIFIRKGLLELTEAESRWRVMNHLIDIAQNYYHGESPIRQEIIRVITLDNISVDVTVIVQFFQSKENDILEKYFHPAYANHLYQYGTVIIELLITDFHVKQINSIREDRLQKKIPLEELDKEIFPDVIPITDKQERLKDTYQKLDFQGNFINSQQNDICQVQTSLRNEQQLDESYLREMLGQQVVTPMNIQSPKTLILSRNPNEILVKNLMTDIPYQAQTSYFIDRFYGKRKQRIGKQQQQHPWVEQDNYPNKTCKYKSIQP